MNSLVKNEMHILKETEGLRIELLAILSDDDLTFALPGNSTLGELCREIGETQHDYIDSFKTFELKFQHKSKEHEIDHSVEKLKLWYAALDRELHNTLEAMSEDDVAKMVKRPGFEIPVRVQFHIYREAILIFAAKASVYLRAMGRELPGKWGHWVG